MAYFPNGTSGDLYEAEYCSRCVHMDPQTGCPILMLHLLWNYEQLTDHDKQTALDLFIPREGVHNGACVMFRQEQDEHDQVSVSEHGI